MSMSSSRTTAILIGCLILSVGLNIPTLIDQAQKLFADDESEMTFEALSDESNSFTITFSEGDGETTITQGNKPGIVVFKRGEEARSDDSESSNVFIYKRGQGGEAHSRFTVNKPSAIYFKSDGEGAQTINGNNIIMLKRDGAEIKWEDLNIETDGLESILESNEHLRGMLDASRLRLQSLSTGENGTVTVQGFSSSSEEGGTVTLRGLTSSSEGDDAAKGTYRVLVRKKSGDN